MSNYTEHRIAYIICATPRSGSTLLCDLLSATGVAGRPDSFFRRQTFSWWANYLGVTTDRWTADNAFDRGYLDAVIREGCGGSNAFGMRLMRENLSELVNRLGSLIPTEDNDFGTLQSAFGTLRLIHLSRRDKVAQAISRIRAEQSGLWHVNSDGSERERMHEAESLRYDRGAILAQLRQLERDDAAWETWFARQQVSPLRIEYEQLSRDPQRGLASVLDHLGIEPAFARGVEPETRKLSDSISAEWRNRFAAELEGERR